MTLPVRRLAMTIAALLMMHVVGMAVDPLGMHADVPDGSSHVHAMTTGHDYDHGASAHTGHSAATPDPDHDLTVLSALTCIDTEGITSHPRFPLEPLAFVALLPTPTGSDVRPCADPSPVWAPPVMDGSELRVFLQVFLN